jgi:predicted transcriptional regulator YheO
MKKHKLKHFLQPYDAAFKAIASLLHPLLEITVHSIIEGEIIAIYNNLSARKVGDSSPLKQLKVNTADFPDHFEPYFKTNFDGRLLKCISITLRDEMKKAVALICFNLDISILQNAQGLINQLMNIKDETKNPIEMFGGQCEVQATHVIEQYLNNNHLSLQHLKRNHKKDLVQLLYQSGVFNFKNAANFISRHIKISRASIYNYINDLNKE